MSKTQIVVLGAGYAGLKTVKGLQKKNLEATITLINKNDYHYEATQLHEVAAGTQPASKISFDIKDVIDAKKVNFIKDTVTMIDKETKVMYAVANHKSITLLVDENGKPKLWKE